MKRSLATTAIGATATLALLTGCGVSASSSGSGSSSSSSASATSSSSTSATINNAIGTQFSGGKPGAASSSSAPITIGMINQQGGQVSDPEASAAVQAAFSYINAEQGGIGGHPLKLSLCTVQSSEAQAQQCAQSFLNNKAVSVVLQGGLNVGSDSVHSTLNGTKPDVVVLANPGTDATAANTYAINPSVIAALPGTGLYARSKGYKTVGIVVDSNPGDLAIAAAIKSVYAGMGLTSKVTTFPAGSTDLTSAFTEALASKPNVITPVVVTTSGCTAAAKALQTLGTSTPVMSSGLCLTPQLKTALGDFPKWAYESTVLSLYTPDSTGQLAFYQAVMAKYAGANAQLGIDAPAAFGAAFVLASVLNKIGPDKITPQSVSAGMKAYTSGVILGTPKVAFGSVKGMPTLSGLADLFYIYQGNGSWTNSGWQGLPQ
jgi:branched-chain amino acid transport system substrate-binding protein